MSHAPDPKILIVEDLRSLADGYAAALRVVSNDIEIACDGAAALAAVQATRPDVIVLDVNLPDMTGIDVLRNLRAAGVKSEVIVMTGEGSMRLAIEAMRCGARDFLVKPFGVDRLRQSIAQALEGRAAAVEETSLAARSPDHVDVGHDRSFSGFIGQSQSMRDVHRLLETAAPSNATVFITGESGTGKELCAEALHRMSKRSSGPFVVINCAAIPRDLLESEIFGHVKGAFTGAVSDRKGAALTAHGGTLFLDEVCEMDIALQAKLLRFLQDRQVRRVGEDTPRATDVRIVCATNRDPHAEVAAGRFREDLLYRLLVVPVDLPPLRARERDAVLIAREFLKRFAKEDGKSFRGFLPEAEDALAAFHWPGNVRQLQNVIRTVVVLNDGQLVTRDMLPGIVLSPRTAASMREAVAPLSDVSASPSPVLSPHGGIKPLETVIREAIEFAITRCGGSIPKAAAALTVSPSTLYRRIQAWEGDSAGVAR